MWAPGECIRCTFTNVYGRDPKLTLDYEMLNYYGRRDVRLKARLIDEATGEPIYTTSSPYICIYFYIDGQYRGMSRVYGWGSYAGYSLFYYRVTGGSHKAQAIFGGTENYKPAQSEIIEFTVQ